MPGVTPYFGLRFKCQGEAVNDTDFNNLASDIDAALTIVKAIEDAVRMPPYARVLRTGSALSVAVATDVTATYTDEIYDSAGIVNLGGSTSNLVAPTDGVYFVDFRTNFPTGFTTLTSVRASILFNGTARYRKKSIQDGVNVWGMYFLSAGQAATVQVRWTGTGGPASFSKYEANIYRVCQP
jgi:hypothetical protein